MNIKIKNTSSSSSSEPTEYPVLGQTDVVTYLQSELEGFLTRCKIPKILTEESPQTDHLNPVSGTLLGKSGWYFHGETYYYFCRYNSTFVLLCGPLTKEEYSNIVANGFSPEIMIYIYIYIYIASPILLYYFVIINLFIIIIIHR